MIARISGHAGRLTVGGRAAAEIGAWSADPLPDNGWRFTAEVAWKDEWWGEQGPFTFTGRVGNKDVVWRDVEATVVGSPIGMRAVGRPEWR